MKKVVKLSSKDVTAMVDKIIAESKQTGEKVTKKKIFPGQSNVATFNPLDQDQTVELGIDGKP